jgi:hypothetical protein
LLASVKAAHKVEPKSKPEPEGYTSMMLEYFVEGLSPDNQARLLDLGLIKGRNVEYLASRVEKLYVYDLVSHLSAKLPLEFPPDQLWEPLDYGPGVFDAIILWDLPDHLEDEHLVQLIKRCHEMMKPGGQLMVIAQGEKNPDPLVRAFEIQEGYKLTAREMPQLRLPYRIRQNRDILKLLRPFIELRIFVYRDGMREFLFKKDVDEPTVLHLNG